VVLVRQRPGTAKGVVFITLEDETGIANAVVWPRALERFRKVVMGARLMLIRGRIQRHEDIIHLVAARLEDRSGWLARLSEDVHMPAPLANADEVRKPDQGSWRGEQDLRKKNARRAAGENQDNASADDAPPAQAGKTGNPLDPKAGWHPRRHPRDARIIPKSRDFH
ncbi:MAG: OB-fold nucleic acid binding domain-containing protein, partial [Pseudomonadota bacterium]|nr:OB-fold nucleic acid binding domain-containing protein [Pseudomonadota bacterium]